MFSRHTTMLEFFFTLLLLVAGSTASEGSAGSHPAVYSFEVVNEYPHDPNAFTQGLLYVQNDTLYESTGLYGESTLRRVHLQTGKVLDIYKMDDSLFGEGLTLHDNRLLQVVWKLTDGFIYNPYDLSQIGTFTHQMQDGWGLATDGKVIYGSDGTSFLYHLDPQTFEVIKKVAVRSKGLEVPKLNELEYINGEVWANIWLTDCIARISPKDGKVLSWIFLPELRENLINAGYNDINVLNGIAWDKHSKRIFVTGKLWPKLYEIKLAPSNLPPSWTVENLCLSNGLLTELM